MHKPLISVITISYNSEAHIENALKSVINQDYSNFEYIVIDGGSTDRTLDIISKYSNSIKYWHSKKDFGITDAFNIGISKSSGSWIIFINSDDAFFDNFVLSKVSNLLNENIYDVVYGKVYVINRYFPFDIITKPLGIKFNKFKYLFNNLIPHQSAFINSKYFDHYGNYSRMYEFCADYELFLRKKSLKVLFLDDVISVISDLGVSRLNSRKVLREWYFARKLNNSCSVILNLYILYFSLAKLFVKNIFLRK